MAQGVKCDVPDCMEFGELPVDPMGGFQPVGNWVEVKIASGRFHACGPEHAGIICRDKLTEQIRQAQAQEEAAQAEHRASAQARGEEWDHPNNGQTA